jgi:hypothetical protein
LTVPLSLVAGIPVAPGVRHIAHLYSIYHPRMTGRKIGQLTFTPRHGVLLCTHCTPLSHFTVTSSTDYTQSLLLILHSPTHYLLFHAPGTAKSYPLHTDGQVRLVHLVHLVHLVLLVPLVNLVHLQMGNFTDKRQNLHSHTEQMVSVKENPLGSVFHFPFETAASISIYIYTHI